MNIRRLIPGEPPPMDLLLLADPSKRLVEDYIHRGHCYIGEVDSAVIGVYVLLPTRPDTVELVNVAVAEERHGQGFGKQLVNHAVRQAKELGFATIEVGTGSTGVAQLALYQKCGFRMTAIDRDFFVRHYEEEIYENGMRLRDMVRLSQDL
ncbi:MULTISPECIES: GNAT family N-acetyltransferase [Paenibacillus]|uniref:GCN5-related N-acetyltransferase n=1 Tax=Paenibacillus lactis 154 TaxID=743719 RepID=G4HPC1_9BACL|nr:GNAT family N-acetyltransferase [Paenibacillus lactis]EHB48566.1 GCN5-related N-acetyltransferase [Paenibacillus lactis 154]MCM3497320.1 GNAT family N-acetyltransferase [Paenibacillus lactis]